MSKKGKGRFRTIERQPAKTLEDAIEALGDQSAGSVLDGWRRVAEKVLSDAGLPVALKVYMVDGEWSGTKPETKQRPYSMRLITKHVELEGWPPGSPESLAASILVEARNMSENPAIEHVFRLGELAGLLRAAMIERKGVRAAASDRFNIWRAVMIEMQAPGTSFAAIWRALPDSQIEDPRRIKGYDVSKDGEKLVAVDQSGKEKEIGKAAFRTGYFRKM